jgi:hypothetical protein
MKKLAFIIWFIAAPLCGQDITLPEKLDAKTNRLGVIEIKSTAKDLAYIVVPSADIDLFREYTSDPAVIRLRFLPYRDGDFSLVVAGALADKVSQKVCVITSSGAVPPPPPPSPDQFTKSIMGAWVVDGKPVDAALKLASVFLGAGDLVANGLDKQGVLMGMHNRAAALIGDTALIKVRNVIADEIDLKLGTKNAPLTMTMRVLMNQEFARIASILKLLTTKEAR